ncbi:hypothetical protein, partial [Mesorhizobium sp. M1C.F.Ca.ET.204.01.1.1]|uniref:hypothetical protein n=1 Tax=Mesorhizobium sp. M1C.F.Ca.ET.204.01.1.1 TaxID=2563929 RepID=UPI001AEE2B9A
RRSRRSRPAARFRLPPDPLGARSRRNRILCDQKAPAETPGLFCMEIAQAAAQKSRTWRNTLTANVRVAY